MSETLRKDNLEGTEKGAHNVDLKRNNFACKFRSQKYVRINSPKAMDGIRHLLCL